MAELRPTTIQNFVNELSNSELSPATVNKIYRYLRSFLQQAVQWGIIAENPCRGILLPRKVKREIECLKPDEINKLLSVSEGKYRALFAVLAYSGLRLGEALALEKTDIDFSGNCIRVRRSWSPHGGFHEPKTPTSRRAVPLLPLLREILTGYLPSVPGPLLFPSPRNPEKPINDSHALQVFKRYLREAGLPEYSLHSLRHSYASLMLNSGCSIKALAHALGHSSPKMTLDIYSHLIEEAMGGALMRADNLARRAGADIGILPGRKR